MNQNAKKVDQLRQELSGLNFFGPDAIKQIETAIQLVRTTTFEIEAEIDKNDFESPEEEIFFFRHIKPPLYSRQIAFRKMLKLELQKSSLCKKEFKMYLKSKLDFIKAHFIDYPEFARYFSSNQSHNDSRYFLRANRIELDCFPHFYDDSHSTGYDVVAAYLLAYKFLMKHYDQCDKKTQNDTVPSKISWVGEKVAFVELVSGLHLMSSIKIDNIGKNDLKTLNSVLCKAFNLDVKDVYNKRIEIRQRKGERFKYLRQMIDEMERHFDENFE